MMMMMVMVMTMKSGLSKNLTQPTSWLDMIGSTHFFSMSSNLNKPKRDRTAGAPGQPKTTRTQRTKNTRGRGQGTNSRDPFPQGSKAERS